MKTTFLATAHTKKKQAPKSHNLLVGPTRAYKIILQKNQAANTNDKHRRHYVIVLMHMFAWALSIFLGPFLYVPWVLYNIYKYSRLERRAKAHTSR